MDSHRENATFLLMRIFTYVLTVLLILVHIFQYIDGFPILKDIVVYTVLCSLLNVSILLTKKRPTAGSHLFILGIFLGLIYIDFFSDKNFSLDFVSSIIYLLPVAICIFVLNRPTNVLFSALFLAVFAVRVFFVSKLRPLEDLITFVMTGLSVFVMVTVKIWLTRLFGQKINTLTQLNATTTEILGRVVELRDGETSDHLERVKIILEEILYCLIEREEYSLYLSAIDINDLTLASTLHDVGKIGIPDDILLKPGKLTREEYEIMKTHTVLGFDILNEAKNKVENQDFYDLAIEISRYHHEWWDGTGYPDRLKGDAIPLSARIMAVADVYDALISVRPYKKAFSHKKAMKIIQEGRGTQFDPEIVDLFVEHQDKIRKKFESLS